MIKTRDIDYDADDDEVRNSAITELCESHPEYWGILPQDSVFIASSQIRREVLKGKEIDGQHNTYRLSQQDSQLPARPPYCKTGFTDLYNYFVTGEEEIANFSFPAIHI
jgi:hypothetical protein